MSKTGKQIRREPPQLDETRRERRERHEDQLHSKESNRRRQELRGYEAQKAWWDRDTVQAIASRGLALLVVIPLWVPALMLLVAGIVANIIIWRLALGYFGGWIVIYAFIRDWFG